MMDRNRTNGTGRGPFTCSPLERNLDVQNDQLRLGAPETEAKLAQTERTRRQREAQDHPALKTVREVFPDVLWMEPEIDEINAEELPHVQSI